MRTKQRQKKKSRTTWRASWKGELRFGLVRFTVDAVNAHLASGSDIHFHQLHADCHRRIEYHKVCPVHGEVTQDEIVLGYNYARGKYVEIDPKELDALRTQDERALTIDQFIAADELDAIHLDGRIYYLVPAATQDREPYHLLRRAMEDDDRIAVGQVVFSGKEQLAAILPRDDVLVMAMLNYARELRDPQSVQPSGEVRVSTKNLSLAKQLIESMTTEHFSYAKYEDRYRERVMELIDAKRKGKEVAAPEEEEEEPVINLMEALKQSVNKTKAHHKKPARRGRKAV